MAKELKKYSKSVLCGSATSQVGQGESRNTNNQSLMTKWPLNTRKKRISLAATMHEMHRAVATSGRDVYSSNAPFARNLMRLLWHKGLGDE